MQILLVISLILMLMSAYFYRKARPYLKYPMNVRNYPRLLIAMFFPGWFDNEGKRYCQYGLIFFMSSLIIYIVNMYIG